MQSIDISIQSYFNLFRTSNLTELVYLITVIFDFSIYFVLLATAVALLIYLFKNIYNSLLFLSSILFGATLVYFLKILFNVSRPSDGVMAVLGKSFPSGHATVSTIFFVMIMYIFHNEILGYKKIIFNTFFIVCIFLVAFSRVYLGVHWVSDVVFGVLLGLCVSWFSILVYKKYTA